MPNFALEPDGFGTTFTGSFVVTLKLFLDGFGDGFALGLMLDGEVGSEFPSIIVTLIF